MTSPYKDFSHIANGRPSTHFSESKAWANSRLKFGIKLLKGLVCSQEYEKALSDCISIRKELANCGFWWQTRRLDNWINLSKKRGGFLADHRDNTFTAKPTHSPQDGGDVTTLAENEIDEYVEECHQCP